MIIFSIIIGFVFTTVALAFPQDRNSEQYYQQQQPQQQQQQQQQQNLHNQQQHFQGSDGSTPIPIISQTEVVGPDGSFNYSYETGNGIQIQEGGYLKKVPGISSRSGELGSEGDDYVQVLQGSFSYTAPDGQVISLRYIADENGFQPEGDHLPTTPAIPQDILRSLNEIRSNPDDQQQYQHQQQQQTQQLQYQQQQPQQRQQQQQYQQQRNQQQTFDHNPPPAGTFPNFQDSTQANF